MKSVFSLDLFLSASWRTAIKRVIAGLVPLLGVVLILLSQAQAAASGGGAAPETPASPYLRIEAGQHVAMINRIALNQEGSLLLTVSDDKTGRLWSLPGGQLRGVLRTPIGDGTEGAIYAGALSPDGGIALLAGAVTNNENAYSLYLFDTATLRMKNRLSKLPASILHLAYSPDGGQFAAAFGDGFGIMVWDAKNGKKAGEDRDYGGSCNWISYASDGRMATSSDDGFIRIYDSQYKILHKVNGKSGKKPYGVAFSGDGKFLAVGYQDKLGVDLIDTATGKVAKSPDVKGLAGENLSMVTWSGGDLLAAGGAGVGDKRMIRRWPDTTGKPVDLPVAENTVTSLATLPDGHFLYATAEPSWGIVDSKGHSLVRLDSPITDFRGIFQRHFTLSDDGMTVEWQLRPNAKGVIRFDLSKQEITSNPSPVAGFSSPMVEGTTLSVTRWENTSNPLLKNKYPISLARNEISRSLAIAADQSSFVLGTDYTLHWFDAQGEDLVKTDIPVPAYGVNLSKDGRYLVAALADGTLRWYRLQRGTKPAMEEYAAVFPSVDGQRWIAWTREGFFAHSMNGGKGLAGYHLNRGPKKTPEWIDFGQLYQSFYSPSLLTRKLAGGHEVDLASQVTQATEVIHRLFVAPVPQVELVEYCPSDGKMATRAFRRVAAPTAESASAAPSANCFAIGKGTATRAFSRVKATTTTEARQEEPVILRDQMPEGKRVVRLRFKIKEREGGLGEIHLLRNGVVVENADAKTRGFSRVATPTPAKAAATTVTTDENGDMILERELELVTGVNRIQIRAYDGINSANGKSGLMELVVPEVVTAAAEPVTRGQKPTLHIISIGVDKYRQKEFTLAYAVKDAKDVAALLEKNLSPEFGKAVVWGRYDEQATKEGVEKVFNDVAAQLTAQDTAVVYMAGHGVNENNTYYFITQNATTDDYETTAFSQGLVAQNLAKLSGKAKNVLVFLDSCHSGAFNVTSKGSDTEQQAEALSKVRERVGDLLMIAAAGPGQEAADGYKYPDGRHSGNGLFGYTVLTGLGGNAAGVEETEVTASQIAGYVTRKINKIRKAQPHYTQKPAAIPNGSDLARLEFPLTEKKAD